MAFNNPHGALLKEDAARLHWEEHVALWSSMHINHRNTLAAERCIQAGDPDPTTPTVLRMRKLMEEEEFQSWYKLKQAKGMANFNTDDFDDDED